jgi:hypothetical protein
VKEVGIVTYMFLKFAGCGAKVATEEKKVIHGHSCKISIHVLSPEGEILDKGGRCTVVGCKHYFSHFLVFSC